jgi:hypothetical protein
MYLQSELLRTVCEVWLLYSWCSGNWLCTHCFDLYYAVLMVEGGKGRGSGDGVGETESGGELRNWMVFCYFKDV